MKNVKVSVIPAGTRRVMHSPHRSVKFIIVELSNGGWASIAELSTIVIFYRDSHLSAHRSSMKEKTMSAKCAEIMHRLDGISVHHLGIMTRLDIDEVHTLIRELWG